MLARLLRFVGEAELLGQWLENWIEENQINYKNILFYSFWFDQLAMGVGLLKDHFPDLKLVSRAHGYDIYEERYNPPYWPCRQKALEKLNKLFLASEDARSYMLKKYPKYSSLYETAHLGVQDSGFTSSASQDGVFRIISCSSLVPLKRIDLLIRGINRAAQMRPNQKFIWHHFGDGQIRRSLQKELKLFPQNAEGYLVGYVPIEQIMNYYRENPVDVIVNVSESEGGSPVSIMEALSCSIPAIATAVGGNPEIVSERNGILLNADPSPDDVAEALLKMLDNPEEATRKRAASQTVWQEKYDAARNFDAFAKRLKAIMGVLV
jgi:colanic acid/amylovoran biosynthesis glycosyltransferase